jgi:alpha-galactosidase
MPQIKLTVNRIRGIIARMTILTLHLDSFPQEADSQFITASSLHLSLPQPPNRFFRHGWQSWTLTTWLDPSEPPYPISSPQFRAKDEDPAFALAKNSTMMTFYS